MKGGPLAVKLSFWVTSSQKPVMGCPKNVPVTLPVVSTLEMVSWPNLPFEFTVQFPN